MAKGIYSKLIIFISIFSSLGNASETWVQVQKSKRLMTVFQDKKSIAIFRIALGGNPIGHKKREGDQKTPEGSYYLDYINEHSAFYRSMHISYPNRKDKVYAQKLGFSPGGNIMIHGQKNGYGWAGFFVQFFDWTDGCIALTDAEMDAFLKLVPVGSKIVIRK